MWLKVISASAANVAKICSPAFLVFCGKSGGAEIGLSGLSKGKPECNVILLFRDTLRRPLYIRFGTALMLVGIIGFWRLV